MREYGTNDEVGTLIGDVTRQGNASGEVSLVETVALDANARYISVSVTTNGKAPRAVCNASFTGTSGCTVLAVPSPALVVPRQVTNIVIPSIVTAPNTIPSASPSP